MSTFIYRKAALIAAALAAVAMPAAAADPPSYPSSLADAAFGSNSAVQSTLGVRLVARDGAIELGSGITRPAALSLEQVFGSAERYVEHSERSWTNGSSVVLTLERRAPPMTELRAPHAAAPQLRLAAFSLVARQADGVEVAVGVGGQAANYFGAGGLDIGNSGMVASVPALANPYFAMSPSATHAGISREFGGIRIKYGYLTTGLNHGMALQAFDPGSLSPALVVNRARVNSKVLEFSKSFDGSALSLSMMRSVEEIGYLGMRSGDLTRPGTATNSVQLTGIVLLAPKVALAAQASYGRSPGDYPGAGGSRTNAFSLALVAADRMRHGDRFSIALSQPIRAYAGTGYAEVVTGVDANGAQIRERRQVSLIPTGRELLAEMNYVAPVGRNAYAGWSFALRRNADNQADAPAEKLLAVRYMHHF